MVLENIRQLFHIETLKRDVDVIPPSVSVLMLIHPKELPKQTLYAVDQFVMRGGKLLVFLDPYSEADPGMGIGPGEFGEGKTSELEPLFAAWGARMAPNQVVLDASYAMSVGVGEERRPVRHPAWLSLPQRMMDSEDVVTSFVGEPDHGDCRLSGTARRRDDSFHAADPELQLRHADRGGALCETGKSRGAIAGPATHWRALYPCRAYPGPG
jgi:hypothetical protein